MMVAVASLTLAFVVVDESVSVALDDNGFPGLSRVAFYALLAIGGVAALVVVFFFPDRVSRERRAGWEALPLVASLVGLQVTMLVIPVEIRTATISEWTVQNWGFALFILIASVYLTYGFAACVNSVRKFYATADGYLRVSLGLLIGGLGLLALSAVGQIVFVIVSATDVVRSPWLVTTNRVVAILGIVVFLAGISYPHGLRAGADLPREPASPTTRHRTPAPCGAWSPTRYPKSSFLIPARCRRRRDCTGGSSRPETR